jgi:hypothetical protein
VIKSVLFVKYQLIYLLIFTRVIHLDQLVWLRQVQKVMGLSPHSCCFSTLLPVTTNSSLLQRIFGRSGMSFLKI